MRKVPLCPNNANIRAAYLNSLELPDNYMGDFSVMGFVVDRYSEAVTTLNAAGYKVDELDGGVEIYIEGVKHLPEIKALLATNNISCELSDIADTFYQA